MAYRNIHDRFWTDPKVKQLTPEQKLLFLYLVTNPHCHVAGIYHISLSYVERETGLKSKDILSGISRLAELEIAYFDQSVELVWVRKMLNYQGHGMKIRNSVKNHLNNLHKSKLISLFCEVYSYPMPYPIDRVSDGVSIFPFPDPVLSTYTDNTINPNDIVDKPKKGTTSKRIQVVQFREDMPIDEYCLTYANAHGLNGKAEILWGRFIDWHLKGGKGTKDLHASWRTFVGNAPRYNPDLFPGPQKNVRSANYVSDFSGNRKLTEEEPF